MLEEKLVAIDSGIDDASERTREIATILRALRKSSGVGNLAQVHRQMTDLNLRVDRLREISNEFQTVLAFDEENYLGSEAFLQELTKAAAAIGVQIVEGHDCLYIYPTSLRVNPQKRCLVVGRRRDARIRPTFVAQELKRLQDDSGRISESAFLEILFQAYLLLARGAASGADGSVIKLSEIYGVLTLLPQVSKEYTPEEFAIDVYRLDRSGLQRTRTGAAVSFPASTGTRASSGVLSVVSPSGEEIRYFGVSFHAVQPGSLNHDDETAMD